MIIIKNGALVTPQGLRRADLAMDGDKIVRIAAAIEPAEGDTGRGRRGLLGVSRLYRRPHAHAVLDRHGLDSR